MADRRVLKWAVPVDDRDHPIGSGPVVLVAESGSVVYVWTDESGERQAHVGRRARVYGTGHQVPPDDLHLGSVVAWPFVWHVFGSPVQ